MTSLPEPLPPKGIRISDAEREKVAERLREAAAQGRLDLAELDERLSAVYQAKTDLDLRPITSDLPVTRDVMLSASAEAAGNAPARRGYGVAIMSAFERRGRWIAPRLFTAFAFWGSGLVDLREARLTSRVTRITAIAIMAGVDVIVPDDVNVQVTGLGLMGGFDHKISGTGPEDAPTVIISGLAFWGGVSIRRKRQPGFKSSHESHD